MFYLFRNPQSGQNTVVNFNNVSCIEHLEGEERFTIFYSGGSHSVIHTPDADAIFNDLFGKLANL